MKISQTGAGRSAQRGRKNERADAGAAAAFKSHIQNEGASSASGASAAAPLAALSSLLAVQEIPADDPDRRRALLKGNALLDELTDLQVGLVQGWAPEETLRRVTDLLDRPRPKLDDPELDRILDDIEVRAAVELAKLDRDSNAEP
jgi:hypothetical protein